ncbi:MAG: response regulator [PVC group bacterium]|nr:response regulator [PVC group bacterium]
MPTKILLIEHNPDHILLTERILQAAHSEYQIDSVRETEGGIKKIIEEDYDLVISDYRLPGASALDILREIREKNIDIPFVVVTAVGNEKIAVDLMKEGAYDYVVKDASYHDILPMVVEQSIGRHSMKKAKEKAQEELVNAYQMTRDILEKSPFGISVVNDQGKVEYINPAMIEICGAKKEDFEELNYFELETYKQLGLDQKIKQALQGEGFFLEAVEYTSYYGHKRTIRNFTGVPVKDMNKRKVLMFVEDITELKVAEQKLAEAYQQLKETQEELIQSSKMVAMGQLAAGISHELNQPLTGVKGFAQAALMDLQEANPLRNDLQKIIEQADRMDIIIKNVRFFARKSEFKMEEMDINKPIEDSLGLLNEQLRVHNVRITRSLSEDILQIKGDRNQLQQVFLNLITNARDAIDALNRPEGGEIIISTSMSLDKKNIEIIFQDTGGGIPQEHLEHVFNPFYTTKSPNGGMGLGLSIAYRIIENHKGTVEVDSEEGYGTKFRITLPVGND